MNRSKIVAIITGAISIILAIAYLILVQLLDYRGEMKPAPISLSQQSAMVTYQFQKPFDTFAPKTTLWVRVLLDTGVRQSVREYWRSFDPTKNREEWKRGFPDKSEKSVLLRLKYFV